MRNIIEKVAFKCALEDLKSTVGGESKWKKTQEKDNSEFSRTGSQPVGQELRV